jgi:DNA helicase-2/ATP-dependent DNA helicase PcrA
MEDTLLRDLNDEQREAVTTTEGYVAVIAGAGSGKTRALTRRFAYLVNDLGIAPGNLLCVTFTNKAASEMRERIHALTHDRDTGYINTFHGFCVSVLQEDSHIIRYPKSFLVLDNTDIDDMLKLIYEERGLSLRDKTFAQARDMFEMRKCIYERTYYKDLIDLSLEQLQDKYRQAENTDDILFYGYLYQEKKCFGLDYNDLIILTLHIFEASPETALKWQKRLQYIMIDEFQDIDPLQYELMEALSAYHHNLFVVGDPDQTIYTWRGARIGYILEFAKTHPGTKTILMMKNYRSTPEILAAANSLISVNKNRIKKDLVPLRDHGPEVRYHHARTQEEEARFLAGEITKHHEAGIPFHDITILYRAHYVSRWIEQVFLQEKIPYRIYSGIQFYARAEIKDALAYLRMIAFQDDLSFRRVVNQPKRNIGRRRMAFLEAYAQEHHTSLYQALQMNLEDPLFTSTRGRTFVNMIERFRREAPGMPISQLLNELLEKSGYERMLRTEGSQERLDNLAELKQAVLEYEMTSGEETDLAAYLNQTSMFTSLDVEDAEDQVRMMTVHAAKGLEFPYVYLAGMNEGIFPSRKITSPREMEEERRLAFVALTRAEKALVLSDAEGRNFNNTGRYPSRFVLDIDRSVIAWDSELPPSLLAEAREYIEAHAGTEEEEEQPDLVPGTRFQHPVFGPGTVQDVDTVQGTASVRFDCFTTERTLSLAAVKKMKKL